MWSRRQVAVVLASLLVIVSGITVVLVTSGPGASGLLAFRSYGELSSYLSNARSATAPSGLFAGFQGAPAAPTAGAPASGQNGAPSYSQTNVQVAGVDELDMVKTDGTYLYVASQGEVVIFLAFPATDLHVVSRIPIANLTGLPSNESYVQTTGLFLNGPELVVVAQAGYGYRGGILMTGGPAPTAGVALMPIGVYTQKTFVYLFDVADPAAPVLVHSLSITGYPGSGRMVGSIGYFVATEWIQQVNGTYAPPVLCVDGTCADLPADRIFRDPQSVDAWDYTNLLAVNLTSGESSAMSIVTGGYSVLYMSPTAMYLAFLKWTVASSVPVMGLVPMRVETSWTTVYKLRADGLDVAAVGSADVPGSLLSQYSMDEYHGYLRVATTVRDWSGSTSSVRNDLYVFDGAMAPVSSLVGLAPGESIFAVRFMEDRAYVVTFRKIDPLFVIDLSDPTAPRVTGFLEMPGFSEYLHPVDPGHLLGVGKDAIPAVEGNWSWYQGLKVSLYDVTNGSSPSEVANVTIGDRGSDSEVLRDPHAFLYIPERGILVLPVDLAVVDPSLYPGGVPEWAWGTIVWQGAYVYRVNTTSGFELLGKVTHGNGTVNATYGWYDSPTEIRRSLYIGDVLYTVSATVVLASSLSDLSEIASVVYASPPACAYGCPMPLLAA